jgi:hypothetical protein
MDKEQGLWLELRSLRDKLAADERRADLAWRDRVSGLRAEFAREVQLLVDAYKPG